MNDSTPPYGYWGWQSPAERRSLLAEIQAMESMQVSNWALFEMIEIDDPSDPRMGFLNHVFDIAIKQPHPKFGPVYPEYLP
jgi:hypothetical protein